MWIWLLATALAQEQASPPADGVEEEAVLLEEVELEAPVAVRGLVTRVFDNGLRVSVYTDPDFPLVASQIWVGVGGAHEGADERGFAHMFEHMMFGGTEENPRGTYEQHVHDLGGYDNAYTSWDETVYVATLLPEGLQRHLELEADRFANLDVSPELLAREKKIVTEELRLGAENSPQARLAVRGLERLMNGHPYGHTPAGTKEDIAAATLELTRNFHDWYYRPGNLHLVISGPLPAETVLDMAEATLGALEPGGKPAPEVPPLHTWDLADELVLQEDLPPIKATAFLYRLPPSDHPDQWALEVMVDMLAGGQIDRFREEMVTERGQALEAFTAPLQLAAGGALGFATVTLPFKGKKRLYRQIEEVIEELDSLSWCDQEALDQARRKLLLDAYTERLTAESMADSVGAAHRTWGDPEVAVARAERLQAVTLEDVQRVWRTWVSQATPIRGLAKAGKPREDS